MDQEYSIRTLLLYAHDIDVNVYIYMDYTTVGRYLGVCRVCRHVRRERYEKKIAT